MLMRVTVVIAGLISWSLASVVNSLGIFATEGSAGIFSLPDPAALKRGLRSNSGERVTNAARFRAGLPPLPPKRTRTSSALRARTSPISCARISNTLGTIAVNSASDGELLGYIRREYNGQNSYTRTADISEALTILLPEGLTEGDLFKMFGIGSSDGEVPYVGAVGDPTGFFLGPDKTDFAYLSGMKPSAAGSPPSYDARHSMKYVGYETPAESTIWSINCATLAFTGQWINSDGSQPGTSVIYDSRRDFLGLTGDYDAYVNEWAGGARELVDLVTFKFVPNA